MQGFDQEGTVPTPPAGGVSQAKRDRLVNVMAAVVGGATPEEITVWLSGEFPAAIVASLDRPLERDEMHAYVDVCLSVISEPALVAA